MTFVLFLGASYAFAAFAVIAYDNGRRIDAIAWAIICAACLALGIFVENMG